MWKYFSSNVFSKIFWLFPPFLNDLISRKIEMPAKFFTKWWKKLFISAFFVILDFPSRLFSLIQSKNTWNCVVLCHVTFWVVYILSISCLFTKSKLGNCSYFYVISIFIFLFNGLQVLPPSQQATAVYEVWYLFFIHVYTIVKLLLTLAW